MSKKLVRIKEGALVGMDHRIWTWPDVPNANSDMMFEVESIGSGKVRCLREGFGILGSPESYGNGAIYASDDSLVEVDSENSIDPYLIENLAKAAERYIDAVNDYHTACETLDIDNSEEVLTERYRALKSAIYHVRKKSRQ